MMKKLLKLMTVACAVSCLWILPNSHVKAEGIIATYTFDIERTMDQTTASPCVVSAAVLQNLLGVDQLDFTNKQKVFSLQANGKVYKEHKVSPLGNFFSKTGNVVATKFSAVASITFDTKTTTFSVLHYSGDRNAQDGETYTMREVIVNEASSDTIVFVFNMTMGTKQKVTSDMPSFVHRADIMDSWVARPFVQVNDQAPEYTYCVQVNAGDNVTLGMRGFDEEDQVVFNVTNPAGRTVKRLNSNDYTLNSVEFTDRGVYKLRVAVQKADGTRTSGLYDFIVDVQERQGEYFDWDQETPYWSYDFRDEYESIPQPTKTFTFKQHNGKDAYAMHGDWWSVFWGDNLNTEVWDGKSGETVDGDRKHAMSNILKKFDEDYAYIRNVMGWPPDLAARSGYKSFIYVFGSGINRDNTPNTEQGGYQGYTQPANADRGYACVYASYYPMSRFRDDADSKWNDGEYQREAMIHEGIHAIFADYPGCKKSAWFQEAGNVWLQGAMNAKRGKGAQVSGWLGVGNLICPFMPIECYSGWLQDGSFGGPAAEGVNMYGPTGQVCTWRDLIGGVQYGETFPIFLGLNVGIGSVPWIWRYCNDYVLKGIAEGKPSEGVDGIGDEGMRQLILHYRAKLATMDFKESSRGMRNLLDGAFGRAVRAEWHNGVYDPSTNTVSGRNASSDQMPCWIDVAPFTLTPYQTLTLNDAEGWMAPDPMTNPGWSGGNIIPVHVGQNGCEVFFRPEDSQMRAQLCYRTKDGRTFYSQPVLCGKMKLSWDASNSPANGVAFIVVCNTDYIYTGEEQRKHHWDYRIKLGEGAYAPASIRKKWYFYEQNIVDEDYDETLYTDIEEVVERGHESTGNIRILTSVLKGGQKVQLDLGGIPASEVKAHLVGLSGVVIDEQQVADDGTIQLPSHLQRGLYVLALNYHGSIQSFKVFAE